MRRFIAGLFIGLVFAGFMALGFWQIARLHWKLDLIATIDRYQSETVDLTPYIDDATAEFRHGTITGVWDEVSVLATKNVTMNGNFGHWIATSLDLGAGKSIVVNRGWVPEGSQNNVVNAALPRGPV
ncbi:MAG TPA: SURF1 family protein, partial [Alphaproteobacteria bacterium]